MPLCVQFLIRSLVNVFFVRFVTRVSRFVKFNTRKERARSKKKKKKTGLKIFDFPLRIIEKNGLSLSCSKYEFPFRFYEEIRREAWLWKIAVTIVTECIIRGIQHDTYTSNTIQRPPRVEKKVSRVSFMEVASRLEENERKETSSPDNSKSGK